MEHVQLSKPLHAADVSLDLHALQLPSNLLRRYQSLIECAVEEMQRLEAGEVINVDEQWQTGHYWLRAPELAPSAYRDEIVATTARIARFAESRRGGRNSNLLWIGIGGSGLGPQLLYDALRIPGKTPGMYFFDNTDPAGMNRTLADLQNLGGLAETLTVVVSKSGGTKETRNGMLIAEKAYRDAGLSFADHAVAITKAGSQLDQTAVREKWLDRFPMWDWVGGRTSISSAVGLLPGSLLGFDVAQFLLGAKEMDQATRDPHPPSNPALALAAAWYHLVHSLKLNNLVVLPYCDALQLFGKYLQQLIMESIGKNGHGLSVFGNKGSTDQHSFVQQLRDGRRDFFAAFVRVLDPDSDLEVEPGITAGDYLAAFQEGTEQALADAGRPSFRLTVPKLNSHAMGALVALLERTVGFYAAMLGINAYHQPGVEAGKVAADGILMVQIRLIAQLNSAAGQFVPAAQLARDARTTERRVHDILGRLSITATRGVEVDSTSTSYRVTKSK